MQRIKQIISLIVLRKKMPKGAFSREDFPYWSTALIKKQIFFRFDCFFGTYF
jgi:hypothetical protein